MIPEEWSQSVDKMKNSQVSLRVDETLRCLIFNGIISDLPPFERQIGVTVEITLTENCTITAVYPSSSFAGLL